MEKSNPFENFNKASFINTVKPFLEVGAIIVSLKTGIFELLSDSFKDPEEIITVLKLKCKARNLLDLLNKLFSIGLLEKVLIEEKTKFKTKNTFFLKSNPENLIPYYLMFDRFLRRLVRFDELLYNGEIANFQDPFALIYSNPTDSWSFLISMALLHKKHFESISEKFDFTPFKSIVDVGGALGLFSILVKKKHPEIICRTFDIPKIHDFVEKYMDENGLKGKIEVISGDMFVDDYPKSDLVVMSNVVYDWSSEKKSVLFKKAFEALNEGGAFMVIEEFLEDGESEQDGFGLNLSLLMFVECNEGFNITFKEAEEYAKKAGFKSLSNIKSLVGISGIVCYK